MAIELHSSLPIICYKKNELKEKLFECLIMHSRETDKLIPTEFTYCISDTGFTLVVGEQKIICYFVFDKEKFSVLLYWVYKRFLKIAEKNKMYCFTSASFNGEKITANLSLIN